MKKFNKTALSVGILLSGFAVVPIQPDHTAHAAITPYYTYNGYAGYNASFVLDKSFINALKYNNVTMNNVKVDAKIQNYKSGDALKFKKIYDQEIEYIGKKPTSITFLVKNKSLKLADVKRAYKGYKLTEDKIHGGYVYNVNGNQISFASSDKKYVSVVMIGRYHA